jgi:Concanavalin A-like lectin/glucanases superfamily
MPDYKLGGSYSHWAYCDICGGKYKNDKLRKNWKNQWVCAEDYETRHPLDFYRPRNDSHILKNPGNKDTSAITSIQLGAYETDTNWYDASPTFTTTELSSTISATPTADWTTNTSATAWTVMAWVKPEHTLNDRFMAILSTRGSSDAGSWSFEIGGTDTNAARNSIVFFGLTQQMVRGNNALLPYGTWHHVTVAKHADGHVWTYLDGLVYPSQRVTVANLTGNSSPVYIGRHTSGTARAFHGNIRDIRMWNVCKTPLEIAGYANDNMDMDTDDTGLIGWWKCDEGSGVYLNDSQTNYDPMNFTIDTTSGFQWKSE